MVCLAKFQKDTWVHIATSLHGSDQVKWKQSESEGLDLHSVLRQVFNLRHTANSLSIYLSMPLLTFFTFFLLSCRQSRQWGTTPVSCPLAPAVLLWVASDSSGQCAPQLATPWAFLLTWDWGPVDRILSWDILDAPTLLTPGRTALPNLDPHLQVRLLPVPLAHAPLPLDHLNILRLGHHQTHPRWPMNSSKRPCKWW